jgi:hypothetical protein
LLGITVVGDSAPAVFAKSKSEDPVDQQLAACLFATGDDDALAGEVEPPVSTELVGVAGPSPAMTGNGW